MNNLKKNNFIFDAISPKQEMLAYETIWAKKGVTQKRLKPEFENDSLPSEVFLKHQAVYEKLEKEVKLFLEDKNDFSIMVNGSFQYPKGLRDAEYPLELFYYKGNIELSSSKCISIVGARSASDDGRRRASKLAKLLAKAGYTIVSGLADGIDTAALKGALAVGGNVIGVIGTPIDQYYPKRNKLLQDYISTNHLLISQVPFYRYSRIPFSQRPLYFPQRNTTMAALSAATVIVEASERSGTLTQARACFKQKRKLFILNSCFDNNKITWPHTYIKRKDVYRVKEINDILKELSK